MASHIDYYLALSSPWTYLAGPRFKGMVTGTDVSVTLRPFNIMKVFQANGTKALPDRPKPVQANRLTELGRWRKFLDMPLNLHPAHFPVDPTAAGHMVIAAQDGGLDQSQVIDLAFAYLRACWAEERDLADADTRIAIANERGLDGGALAAAAGGADVLKAFEENTELAFANNVFGSPTWICDGELFWGQDRLDFLGRKLTGQD